MNKKNVKAADTTAAKVEKEVGKTTKSKVKGPVSKTESKKTVESKKMVESKKRVSKRREKEPLYTLTHREIDKNSKTVAYHLATRKGARYRVEKPVMIEMVSAGAVKDVTVREVAGEVQVVGIGMSVGLYPKVLNLTELPLRAANLKKSQEGKIDQGAEIESEPEKSKEKAKKDTKTAAKKSDKSIILEVAVSEGTKSRKKKPVQEAELVY